MNTDKAEVVIDVSTLYQGTAKVADLPTYVAETKKRGTGCEVVLTGPAPVWLYLRIAHALHGVSKRLVYRSPATGDVEIFDHRSS